MTMKPRHLLPILTTGFCILYSRQQSLAQVPPTNAIVPATRAVMTDSNSVLKQPTNFFAANSNLLNASVAPGGTNAATLSGAQTFSGAKAFTNTGNSFTGNGSGLTSLTAGNLSGQVPIANGGSAASTQAGFITAAFGMTNLTDLSFAPTSPTNTASGNYTPQLSLTTSGHWLRYWNGSAWASSFTIGPNAPQFYVTDNNIGFWASNGVDNCMELRNFDNSHYSAARFVDKSGNEVGAIGYGNLGSGYADMDYLESFGLLHPFYFVAGGGVIGGMAVTTGDFIWNDNNTNVFFWVRRSDKTLNLTNGLNVSGIIRAGTGAAGGGSSGGKQVTSSSGFLNAGDFDSSATGTVAHDSMNVHGTNFVAFTRNHFASGPISFDGGANGSGINYETVSPGGIPCVTFGVAGAITGMYTSANQGWWAYPAMDIGADTADGTKDTFCVFKVHGSFGTDIKTKSANYTNDAGDSVILVGSAGKTITLPDATSHCAGRIYTVKLTVSGSATVATTSSQNIDGSTTYSLSAQYKYVTIQSDGTQWWIIANN